jgi:hypothetical protein
MSEFSLTLLCRFIFNNNVDKNLMLIKTDKY